MGATGRTMDRRLPEREDSSRTDQTKELSFKRVNPNSRMVGCLGDRLWRRNLSATLVEKSPRPGLGFVAAWSSLRRRNRDRRWGDASGRFLIGDLPDIVLEVRIFALQEAGQEFAKIASLTPLPNVVRPRLPQTHRLSPHSLIINQDVGAFENRNEQLE